MKVTVLFLFFILRPSKCDQNDQKCRTVLHCGGVEELTNGENPFGGPYRGLTGKRGQRGLNGERGIPGNPGHQGPKGEPGENFNATEIDNLKRENKKIKKKMHLMSNYTDGLEKELNQLKNIMYTFMGGKPCIVDNMDILNGNLSVKVGSFVLTGSQLPLKCDAGYHIVEKKKPVCQDGKFSNNCMNVCEKTHHDCNDIKHQESNAQDGVFNINPFEDATQSLDVFCQFDSDEIGWTIIQRRSDSATSFSRNWSEYLAGFGDKSGNHWLGLQNIFLLVQGGSYILRIELEQLSGATAYAEYDEFYIDGETEKFTLHIGQYTGTAGDSLTYHNDMKFTTKDQDNDLHASNCATGWGGGGGWWFNGCKKGNLNGEYQKPTKDDRKGLVWYSFSGSASLKKTVMKIKRKF